MALACPLCEATDTVPLYAPAGAPSGSAQAFRCTSDAYGVHGPIVRCRRCGLAFIDDGLDEPCLIEQVAEVEDPTYVAEEAGRRATFARQLHRLERHAGSVGRLLEVGAYTGVFLELAQDAGWQVAAFEPSTWAAEQASRRVNAVVVPAPFAPGRFPEGSFDAVVAWDVIEHLSDPLAAVRTAQGYLRTGGTLALSTMDLASLASRLLGERWPWLMEMHRVYFTRATMRELLARAGFTDVRFRLHVREVSLGYLASRVATRFPTAGRALAGVARVARAEGAVVPFCIGDLFEVYARKT